MPKKPTLFDAIELLDKHRDALGVEVIIGDWHYIIARQEKTGYQVGRRDADLTVVETCRFANQNELLRWVLEVEGPAIPATKESEQLPFWALPFLADAHGQIMEHIQDATTHNWNETLLAAKVSEALADLIMAVLDDTMSSSGT